MSILYALVARGTTVLAEYTTTSGNFPTITRVLLGKISGEDGKMSYIYDQVVFHYIVENKIIYMCMCDDMNKRRLPFMFLDDIKDRFSSMYGLRLHTAIAFAMNDEFGKILQKQMDHYNSPAADSISTVNTKIDDVKNVMIQNIEMVLERGEKLELLVDKTENLHQQAFKFQKSARSLKSAMICRRLKLYVLIFVIVAILVWVLTVIICGITYDRCCMRQFVKANFHPVKERLHFHVYQ